MDNWETLALYFIVGEAEILVATLIAYLIKAVFGK